MNNTQNVVNRIISLLISNQNIDSEFRGILEKQINKEGVENGTSRQ